MSLNLNKLYWEQRLKLPPSSSLPVTVNLRTAWMVKKCLAVQQSTGVCVSVGGWCVGPQTEWGRPTLEISPKTVGRINKRKEEGRVLLLEELPSDISLQCPSIFQCRLALVTPHWASRPSPPLRPGTASLAPFVLLLLSAWLSSYWTMWPSSHDGHCGFFHLSFCNPT